MKKFIQIIFTFVISLFFISCHSHTTDTHKFLLEGDATLTETVEIQDVSALQEMVESKLSFVLVLKIQSCSSCSSFFKNAVYPYIAATHAKIYSMNGILLEDYPSFSNKPTFRISPTLVIYHQGVIVSSLSYSSNNDVFTSQKGLENHLEQYVIKPRLISLSEEMIQQKAENKESFVLYIGWYRCGDCMKLNEYVLQDYLKEHDVTIYYLESDFYRKNKPSEKPEEPPADASQEEMEAYQSALQAYNLWIEFATRYEIVSYRDGKVPALLYYHQGIISDHLIYHNDVINEEGIVEVSFFTELVGQTMTDEELLHYHGQKVLAFLDRYL